jgi:allantoicase
MSERMGGATIAASDEFFAPKENLVRSAAPIYMADKYTDHGKWMDGWESRRKREAGHDWCVLRLGVPGALHGVDIDTSHFTGNFPSHASLEASVTTDSEWKSASWSVILPKVRLQGGSHNIFDIETRDRFTHVRLNIFPDGGVARLRLFGKAMPEIKKGAIVDWASAANGGLALVCSDMYFGSRHNLIMPGRPANMGEGWETKRRRGDGYDWIVVELGTRAIIDHLLIETQHFKGNYPDKVSVDACDSAGAPIAELVTGRTNWQEILGKRELKPDAVHRFQTVLKTAAPATHVRLNVYPDGGISRLRVFGAGV